MTGNGTQGNPYVPENWDELKEAAETDGAYVRLASYGEWDMNDQYPDDTPEIHLECAQLDFNGTKISNLRKSTGGLFLFDRGNHDVTMMNGFFESAYISNATVFHAYNDSNYRTLKLLNIGFGGELYDSQFMWTDRWGISMELCAISLYMSNSTFKLSNRPFLNSAVELNGTTTDWVEVYNMESSAIYGSIRGFGAQMALKASGSVSVVDIELQNFSDAMIESQDTTLVVNVDKLNGAIITGSGSIQATTAQMHDAAWLNAAGFPCTAG